MLNVNTDDVPDTLSLKFPVLSVTVPFEVPFSLIETPIKGSPLLSTTLPLTGVDTIATAVFGIMLANPWQTHIQVKSKIHSDTIK
jgi:hypothetical protein